MYKNYTQLHAEFSVQRKTTLPDHKENTTTVSGFKYLLKHERIQKEWLKVCEKFSSWYNLYATVFGLSSRQSLPTLAKCHLYFTLSQMIPAEKEVEEQQQAEEIQRQKEQAELE